MGLGDTIKERNKTSKQLICSCENNIVKRDFTNILNLFHAFVLHIKNSFYSRKSNINLLSFKDIRLNEYHIETTNEGDIEYLYITQIGSNKKCVLEKLSIFSYGLYYTYINAIERFVIVSQKVTNKNEFLVWHDRLGHPRYIMMRKIVENSCGHPLKSKKKILQTNEFLCTIRSQRKVDIKIITRKIKNESISF